MYDGVLLAQYKYDGLNRLIREDNQAFNTTYLYSYGKNGNIQSKEIRNFTTTENIASGIGTVTSYSYNTRGQLTSYKGESCTYDAVGNPTTYRGKTLTWERGRKLSNFNGITFTYDAQGKRITKNDIKYPIFRK